MSASSLLTIGLGSFGSDSLVVTLGLGNFDIPVVTGCVVALDTYQGGIQAGQLYQGGKVAADTYQGGKVAGQAGCC